MNSTQDFSSNKDILDLNNDLHNVQKQTGNNNSVAETDASFSTFVATTLPTSTPVMPVVLASIEPEQFHPLSGFIPLNCKPCIQIIPPNVQYSIYMLDQIDHPCTSEQKANHYCPRDQLYFERIHPAIPLLHQRNYLSWSKKVVKKKSQICVQHAMWALVALHSSQYRYLQEQLYRSCSQMLTAICSSSTSHDPFDREQIQAWLLITIYELMRSFHRQAWMSVGRAFRIVHYCNFTSSTVLYIELLSQRTAL